VKEILDKLEMPYIPLLRNYDVWPYQRSSEGKVLWNTKEPLSFSPFKTIFKDVFLKNFQFFKNWKLRETELGNYAFKYEEVEFLVDNVNRRQSPFGLP